MIKSEDYPPGPDLDLQVANLFFRQKLRPIDWCPAYSTDITMATDIIAKLQRRNQSIALRWWPEAEAPGNPGGLWSCHLSTGSYDVAGKTLEHAISLAALAYVDES